MTEDSFNLINADFNDYIDSIHDSSIDLVITDPPYRFDVNGGGFYSRKRSDKREYIQKLDGLQCCDFVPSDFLNRIKPKLRKFYMYAFCNKTLIREYIEWAERNKYSYDILVMCKSNPIPAHNNHHVSDVEYVIMIREKGTYWSKDKDLDIYRKWYMTSCRKREHPAEKPLELVERFVRVSSEENSVILDPFMGSGTTGVACRNLNRRFVGIEINGDYYNLSRKRILDSSIFEV